MQELIALCTINPFSTGFIKWIPRNSGSRDSQSRTLTDNKDPNISAATMLSTSCRCFLRYIPLQLLVLLLFIPISCYSWGHTTYGRCFTTVNVDDYSSSTLTTIVATDQKRNTCKPPIGCIGGIHRVYSSSFHSRSQTRGSRRTMTAATAVSITGTRYNPIVGSGSSVTLFMLPNMMDEIVHINNNRVALTGDVADALVNAYQSSMVATTTVMTTLMTASSSSSFPISPEPIHTAFTIATFFPQPFWLLMILFPNAKITKQIMGGLELPLLCCLIHFSIVSSSIAMQGAETTAPLSEFNNVFDPFGDPQLAFMKMTTKYPDFVAEEWSHVLTWDLFIGRYVWLDGIRRNIFTGHSVLFCNLIGPPGLLLHWITCTIVGKSVADPKDKDNIMMETTNNDD